MITKIKLLRVKIDGLAQLTNQLEPLKGYVLNTFDYNSTEINEAHKSLLLAKAWLGKILGELGNPTPYKNDGNRHSVDQIEPTADKDDYVLTNLTSTESVVQWNERNHIEKVDWLRQEIQKIEVPDYYEWCSIQHELIIKKVDWDNQSKDAAHEEHEKLMSEIPDWPVENQFFYKHLSEARFWLDFELQRIRKAELTK